MADNEKLVMDLIAKALKDPAFKAELRSNPAAAIEKATGVKVPAGVTIKVVEDTASTVHLVLPGQSKAKGGELSEKQLEGAVGGVASPAGMKSLMCGNSSSPCYS